MNFTDREQRILDMVADFRANGISRDPKKGLQKVLDYQNSIGHMSLNEIDKFNAKINHSCRRDFYWVNFLTLDYQASTDILSKRFEAMAQEVRQDQIEVDREIIDVLNVELENAKDIIERQKTMISHQVVEMDGLKTTLQQDTGRDAEIDSLKRDLIRLKVKHDVILTGKEIAFLVEVL